MDKDNKLMRKNKIMSLVSVYSLIFTVCFAIVFVIAFLISLIVGSPTELSLGFSIAVLILLVFHFILINGFNALASKYGKHSVYFSKGLITINNQKIGIDNDSRLIYSKISFRNFFLACPGELAILTKNKNIVLGYFTRREINRIKEYVPNVKEESRAK